MFNDGFLLHNAIKTQLSRTKKGLALISKLDLQIKTFMAGKTRVKFSFFHLNFILQLASIRWFRVYAYTGILLHLQQRRAVRYSNFLYGTACRQASSLEDAWKAASRFARFALTPSRDWIRTGSISWLRFAALFSLDKGQGIPFGAKLCWQRGLIECVVRAPEYHYRIL